MMKINLNFVQRLRQRSFPVCHHLLSDIHCRQTAKVLTIVSWRVMPPAGGRQAVSSANPSAAAVSADRRPWQGNTGPQVTVQPVRSLHSETTNSSSNSEEPTSDIDLISLGVATNEMNQKEKEKEKGVDGKGENVLKEADKMVMSEPKEDEENLREKVLPFEAVPGPPPKPFVGNKLLFTPLGGYSLRDFWDTCRRLHACYGPIVRLSRLSPDLDIVYVFDPEDVRKIYEAEGPLPFRPTFDILTYYRSQRPQWFSSAGLVPGNGPEWQRLRRAVQPLLRRQVVAAYRRDHARVAGDLVREIRRHQDLHDGGVVDILPILFKYTLEAVGVLALATRLGCLQAEEEREESQRLGKEEEEEEEEEGKGRGGRVVEANTATLTALGEAFFALPFYRIFPTSLFRRLASAQDTIATIVEKELSRIERERKALGEEVFDGRHPFLASLLTREDFDRKDVMLIVYEVFQGGIDATATTLAFCLYYLARNPDHQEALHVEVKDVDTPTHNLQGLPYLRAVLREVLRLRPSAAAAARIIARDTVMAGYRIPKGTLVQGPPIISCRDPAVFPDPGSFEPERWLPEGYRGPSGCSDFGVPGRLKHEIPGTRSGDSETSSQRLSGAPGEDPESLPLLTKGSGDSTRRGNSSEVPSWETPSETEGGPSMSRRRKEGGPRVVHPYTVLPFGHGRRMCPGRRIAEQEIYIALIQIVQTYRMKYMTKTDQRTEGRKTEESSEEEKEEKEEEEEDVGQVLRLNMEPDRPIGIQFVERFGSA